MSETYAPIYMRSALLYQNVKLAGIENDCSGEVSDH